MSCNFLNFKDCQIKGSTFSSVKFNFPGRDISGDSFFMLLKDRPQRRVNGIIVENEVLFPYESFQDLMIGRYIVEFWADFADIGLKAIARQELEISEAGKASKCCEQTGAVFGLNTGDTVVEYSISLVVINLREGGEVQWDKIEGKPTVFYDDTEIKEEIAEKVDKVEGFGLSENNFSDADVEKLADLENFDPTDINNALGNKVDKIANKGLSTNDYTTAEKNKLAGLDGNKFFGKFADETALNAVVGIIGGYAYVGGVGRNDESYIWDDDDNKWVKSNNIPTAETPASVKTKYESNPDTNAFTNARRDKLNNAVVASDLPTANVGTATKLQNARTFTLGNTGKPFDGSANLTWTLAEIGALSTTTAQDVTVRKNFISSGGVDSASSHSLFVQSTDGTDPGLRFAKIGFLSSNIRLANNGFHFGTATVYSPINTAEIYSTVGVFAIQGGQDLLRLTGTVFNVGNLLHSTVIRGAGNLTHVTSAGTYTIWDSNSFGVQSKISTAFTVDTARNQATVIANANCTVTIPTGLPDNFEATFIADGGTITFANSGTVFKFNNSKVLLASGGIATLRKENGTNNFYLKGDLS